MIGFPLPTIVRELDGGMTGEPRYLLSDGRIVTRLPPEPIVIEPSRSAPPKEREPNRHERRAKAKRERSGR